MAIAKHDSDTYDNRQVLQGTEFQKTNPRWVGVLIGEPYTDSLTKQQVVRIDTEWPIATTTGAVSWAKADEWKAETAASIRHCIGKIDAVIEELQRHKRRMESNLVELETI